MKKQRSRRSAEEFDSFQHGFPASHQNQFFVKGVTTENSKKHLICAALTTSTVSRTVFPPPSRSTRTHVRAHAHARTLMDAGWQLWCRCPFILSTAAMNACARARMHTSILAEWTEAAAMQTTATKSTVMQETEAEEIAVKALAMETTTKEVTDFLDCES